MDCIEGSYVDTIGFNGGFWERTIFEALNEVIECKFHPSLK